jgi:Fe-S cluster assembly protein SufD
MITTVTTWLDGLLSGHDLLPAHRAGWVNGLRADALERAHALTLPTTRDEDWRFTDLSPLYKLAFHAPSMAGAFSAAQSVRFDVAEAPLRLTFVDGYFVPALSRLGEAGGAMVVPLAEALEPHAGLLQTHLGACVASGGSAFAAINTAYLNDGLFLHAPRGARVPAVHVLNVSNQADVAVNPRLLVIAESGAEVTLVEDYLAAHEGTYAVNAVAEVTAAANASVRHVRLQRDSRAAFHIGATGVRLERDARYRCHSVAFGARISRNDLHVTLAGPGAECELDGLALIGGRQLADTHSFIDHAAADGQSRQEHKCIVGGGAHAVFNGRVLVREGAQRTNSAQQSRNLLLSDKARVDTKPQLEIFADDVKCAHGATIGQLVADEVFYLRSRGLDEASARALLTFAFAAGMVGRIPLPSVVEHLRETLTAHTGTREIVR